MSASHCVTDRARAMTSPADPFREEARKSLQSSGGSGEKDPGGW